MTKRKPITDADFPLQIPEDVAVCPICGARIAVEEIDSWDTETGEIADNEVVYGCVTEPDIESKEWRPWFRWHYRMPYVDWLPLEDVVVRWFNANYAYRPD